jgi:stage V sporulation protein G
MSDVSFPSIDELISEVTIRLLENPQGKTVAFASVVIAGQFVLHDVTVVNGSKGHFVGMPQRQGKDGEYYDRFNPITADARTLFQDAVLRAFDDAVNEADAARKPPARSNPPKGAAQGSRGSSGPSRPPAGGNGRGRTGGGR